MEGDIDFENFKVQDAACELTTVEDFTKDFGPKEGVRVWKNVIAISMSFFCLFSAFQCASNLQSTINSSYNLGTISLTCVYVALLSSCLLLPSLAMKKLTCKWTMVISIVCYMMYILSQYRPTVYTLIPAGLLVGLGAAPLWSAKCTYFTQLGIVYTRLSNQPVENVFLRFFGLFFLIFQTSQLMGNTALFFILKPKDETPNVDAIDGVCGANFCNQNITGLSNLIRPPQYQINILVSVFFGLVVTSAVIMSFFVDSLGRYGEKQLNESKVDLNPGQLMLATVKHMAHPYQLLLIPLTMWSGFEQAFIQADFTKSFVGCVLGVHWIGVVLIAYNLTDAVVSFTLSFVIRHVGRVPIFLLGALLNMVLLISALLWTPQVNQQYYLYIFAALWGMADAIWQTQINAFYAVIFQHQPEAAFSNYRLWESLGFAVQFAYSGHLCTNVKIYLMMAILFVGIVGYVIIELKERWQKVSTS